MTTKNYKPKAMLIVNSFAILLSFSLLTLFGFSGNAFALQTGWYTGDPGTANRSNIATYASQGATLMLPYNMYFDRTGSAAYLTEAAARGIKVWVGLYLHGFNPLPSETDWKNFINTFKSYPAVKGWYIGDEPEWGTISKTTYQQYYNWTKQADPNHPVAVAHSWSVLPEWAGIYDTVLVDVYPGWSWPSVDPNEFNSRVRQSYTYWSQAKIKADSYRVPIEAVALGFGGNQNGVRDLTNLEHKWHSLIPVALGYEAVLFWWDSENTSAIHSSPAMKALVAQRFSEISQISKEMDNGVTNSGLASINVGTNKLIYRYGIDPASNTSAILAVNISRYDVADNNGETLSNVQFTLPSGVRPSTVEVLNENRTLPVTNGVFTDTFDRFAVHIYRFTSSTISTPTPTPTPTPTFSKCDQNHDTSINVLDLQSLANVILGKTTCTPSTSSGSADYTCDLNQDSSVNVLDLQYLANVILGKNTCQ